jgi:hypothetical protein
MAAFSKVLGEIVVTAEKLPWLSKEGETALKPSQRGAGVMVSILLGTLCDML